MVLGGGVVGVIEGVEVEGCVVEGFCVLGVEVDEVVYVDDFGCVI